MPVIDNQHYNRHAATWRDATQPLSMLDALTPGRFAYLAEVLDLAMAAAVWRFKRGRATYYDLGRSVAPGTIKSLGISYMGYAVKRR